MLSAINLRKSYVSEKGVSVAAINGVSLDFSSHGMVFIIGKSGCGKSTLLNLLSGLDKPDSGEIIIDGRSAGGFSVKDYDAYRNSRVGFVFQDFNNMNSLTVGENVALAAELQGKTVTKEDVLSVLERFGLGSAIDKYPLELSGGQMQRVAIARAVIKDTKYLFADEPTGSLDSATGRQVLDVLKELSAERLVVVVTHDTDSALLYADRIIELSDGKVVSDKCRCAEVALDEIKEAYRKQIDSSFTDFRGVSAEKERVFSAGKSRFSARSIFRLILSGLSKSKLRLCFVLIITVFALMLFGLSATAAHYDGATVMAENLDSLGIGTVQLVNNEITEKDGKEDKKPIDFDSEASKSVSALFGDDLFTTYSMWKSFDRPLVKKKFTKMTEEEKLREETLDELYNNTIATVAVSGAQLTADTLAGFYDSRLTAGDYPKANADSVEILISRFLADSIKYKGAVLADEECELAVGCSDSDIMGSEFAHGTFVFKIVGIFDTARSFDLLTDDSETALFYYNSVFSCALANTNAFESFMASKSAITVETTMSTCGKELSEPLGVYSIAAKKTPRFANAHVLARENFFAGICFPSGNFEKGCSYKLSFGLQKLQGTLVLLGGHMSSYTIEGFFIDGVSQEPYGYFLPDDTAWGNENMSVFDDGKVHLVELFVTYAYDSNDSAIYVQPNRFVNDPVLTAVYNLSCTELPEDAPPISSFGEPQPVTNNENTLLYVKQSEFFGALADTKITLADGYSADSVLKDDEVLVDYKFFLSLTSDLCCKGFSDIRPETLSGQKLKAESNSALVPFDETEFKIVGVFNTDEFAEGMNYCNAIIVSEGRFLTLIGGDRTVLNYYVPLSDSVSQNARTVSALSDAGITAYSSASGELELFDTIHYYFSDVIIWACVALLGFVCLLLYNFISGTIERDRKEIGILRAMGTAGRDVAKIYLIECAALAVFCAIASTLASLLGCYLINHSITRLTENSLKVFTFGWLPAMETVCVCFAVIAVSCFLPLLRLRKQNPVALLKSLSK